MKRINEFDRLYNKSYKDITFPNIIDIELTNRCNLSCRMCSRQIMNRDMGYMSTVTFNKIIDECIGKDIGIRFIRWGEPTLHKNIITFIEKVKDNNIPLHITTNGNIISLPLVESLVDLNVDSIIFSMQGSTGEEYNYMRKFGDFALFYNTMVHIIHHRKDKETPYIHITSTMTERDKEEDIEKFKKYWLSVGVDKVTTGITSMHRLEDTDYIKQSMKCKEPLYKLSIDWDGKVSACCGDYDNLLTVGDVNKDTLYNIWNNNPKLDAVRKILNYGDRRMLTLCNKCYPAYESF